MASKCLGILFLLLCPLSLWAQMSGPTSATPNTNCSGVGCNYTGPSILINEIMLSPSPGDGSIWESFCSSRCAEWIELYNPDICLPVDISCYFLGNNANDGLDYPGGYTIPPGTIVPPRGFVVIRGQMAPPVPSHLLLQNGGRTLEIVMSSPYTCIGNGHRLWFPNAGGWFAFYDANGVPQDAVSWGNLSNLNLAPCVSSVPACSFTGQLPSYSNIPANRKTMISSLNAGNHINQSLRRSPDGGAWQISNPQPPTYGTCNAQCTPPPVITCTGTATVNVSGGVAPYSYIWNDSQMQTSQTATGLCAGNYCVLVRDAVNNMATFCVTVVNTKPAVNAGNDTIICAGSSYLLSATGSPGTTFTWNQSLGLGASHLVFPTGPTQYIVTAIDPGNCTNKDTVNVSVTIGANVSLSSNSPVCEGEDLVISENISSGVPLSWSGPNGFSSNQQTIVINNAPASASGTYTLSANLNGCVNSTSINVTVNPLPSTNAGNSGPGCQGQPMNFFVSGNPGSSFQWAGPNSFSSTQQNPSIPTISIADSGYYYITLTTQEGCIKVDSTYAAIEESPVVDFSFTNQCVGEPVAFLNNSGIAGGIITSYSWDFGAAGAISNDINPVFTYPIDGLFTVELTAVSDKGCTNTATQQVQAYALPVPGFTYSSACIDRLATFVDQSFLSPGHGVIDSWFWDFGDGGATSNVQGPSHTYASLGTFQVSLTTSSSFGCSANIQVPVEVGVNPTADFSFISACQNDLSTFTSSSTIPSPGALSGFNWDFGDGSNGSGATASHTYTIQGNFDVKLVVNSTLGCMDSIVKTLTIAPSPVSDFAFTDICIYDVAEFTNASSIVPPAEITGFTWDFGDGSPGVSDANTQHNYVNPGQYLVSLTSTSGEGCVHTIQKNIQVYEPPVADFLVNDVCSNVLAIFQNISIDPSAGSIAQYLWNFGNGTGNQQNPPGHTFLPGLHTITLISTIPYGPNVSCADTTSRTIEVFSLPSPDFAFTDVCKGNLSEFTDLSTPPAEIVSWAWDFDDGGAASNQQNPGHTFTGDGSFNVSLKVTSDKGCEVVISKPVVVYGIPVPDFSTPDACVGTHSVFTDASTVSPPSSIDQWIWYVDDGVSVSQYNSQNVQHLFSQVGSYEVKLITTSNHSCKDSISKIAIVNPYPVVDFEASINKGCPPLCVDFTENTTIQAPGQNVHYLWDFGDGAVSLQKNPLNHCYTNASTDNITSYDVSLTAISDKGCSTTSVKPDYIYLYPHPVADFSADPDTAFVTSPFIKFFNQSSGGDTWHWSFGDGNTSALFNPTISYTDTGLFPVKLITENHYGCVDSMVRMVSILGVLTVYIPNAFTPNNDGLNDFFFPQGEGFTDVELEIYNRWGERVFTGRGLDTKWDGRTNNGAVQTGIYNYVIYVYHKHNHPGDPPHKFMGKVTLIR